MATSMAAELDRLTVDTAAIRRMAALAQSELQTAGLRRAPFEPDVVASLEALAASILASEDGRSAARQFLRHAVPVLARTPEQQATLVAWIEGAAAASLVPEIFGRVVQSERSTAPKHADLGGSASGSGGPDLPEKGPNAEVSSKAATPQPTWGEAVANFWEGLSEAIAQLGLGLSRSKRRARLVRKAVSASASRLSLNLPAVRAAGPAASLRRAATSAIVRIPTPTQRLDVERTLRASLRQGGIFCPVFRTRPVCVEYLFLVRQLSGSDLEYVRVEAMLKELKGQGVPLSYYPYRGDPRRVLETMSGARTATLGVEQLYERHPHARLILVTEGRELVNGFTLQPHAWMRRLDLWPLHALVTPLPRSDWGTIEARIHFDLDYAITSSREGGLDRLGRLFSGPSPYSDPEVPMRARSSPSFVTSPSMSLVSEQAPSQEECDALLVELMTHLGPRGFRWLGICAHFPAMSPELALHYGRALFAGEERHDAFGATFAQLSGLPWMRYGAMPYWARSLIVSALPAEQRAEAQALIAATLDPKNLTVEAASIPLPLSSALQVAGDARLALPIRVDGDVAGGGLDFDELAIAFLADGSDHDLDPILKLKPTQISKLGSVLNNS